MDMQNAYFLSDLFSAKGISEIDLLGGEPLLVPWLKEFVLYTTGKGITINISTNGSLPESIEQLKELQTDFLNIGFSVHGLSETHNALTGSDNFSITISGIRILIGAGKIPHVKSALIPENIHEISGIVAYLVELGVQRYYLMFEDTIGMGKDVNCISFPDFWNFYQNLKKSVQGRLEIGSIIASGFSSESSRSPGRCKAGTDKLAILPDGSVFPCNLFAGFQEFCLGNIFIDKYEKILESPVLEYFRNYGKNSCINTDCSHFISCRGGCPAHIYYSYSSLYGGDPRCQKKQKFGKIIEKG
jgi:radical SAM protein with 4Fe4S-binding SPASM domain